MRAIILASTVAIAMTAAVSVAHAQSAATAKPAAAATHYTSANAGIDVLLKNPEAKAVLVKHIPEIANNPQIEGAVGMTLKDLQAFAGDMLTDDVLKKIDADLAKVQKK